MGKYYLAVDIGASSGRHIFGRTSMMGGWIFKKCTVSKMECRRKMEPCVGTLNNCFRK